MTSRTQREYVSDVFSKASSKANKFGRRFSLKQNAPRQPTPIEPLPTTSSTPQLPPLNITPLDTVHELRDVLGVSSAPEDCPSPATVSDRPHTAPLQTASPVPSTTSSGLSENLIGTDQWLAHIHESRTPSPSRSSQRSSEEILRRDTMNGSKRSSREIMLSRTSSGKRSPIVPKKQSSRDSQSNVSIKRSSRDIVDLAAAMQIAVNPLDEDTKRKHDSGFATQSETSADEDDGTLGISRPRIFATPDKDRDVNKHNALYYLIKKTYSAPVFGILSAGCKVLEVSCSTGVWAKDLKARYPMADVYATDTDQYWQQEGNVSFSTCEHTVLPFPDEYFDFIFVRNAVVRMTALRDILPEVIRTLKPGGYIEMQEFELPIQNGGKYASELSLKMQERALANFIDLGISSRLSKVLRSCHELDRIKASSLGMPLAWSSVGEQMSEFAKTAILEMANLPLLEADTAEWMQAFWEECKLNRAVLNYHIAFAQKRLPPPVKPLPSTPSDNQSLQDSQRIMTPVTTLTDPISYITGTDSETDDTQSTVISSLALPSPQISEQRHHTRRGSLFAWSK